MGRFTYDWEEIVDMIVAVEHVPELGEEEWERGELRAVLNAVAKMTPEQAVSLSDRHGVHFDFKPEHINDEAKFQVMSAIDEVRSKEILMRELGIVK